MPEFLLPFTIFAVAGSITPGPNNVMLTASGANYGFRRTLPHLLGICVGFPLMVAAIGLGLGRLFESVPAIHAVLKAAGSIYLLWLAWRVASARGATETESSRSRPLSFFEAMAFQWVNPKAWIMAVGAISTFTTMDEDVTRQVVLITAIFAVISIFSASIWTLMGVLIARLLQSARAVRAFNMTMGGLLALSVVWILLG